MKKLIRILTLLLALLMVLSSCAVDGEVTEETTGTIVSDEIIPPAEDDPLKEKIDFLEGYVKFQSKKGTQAAPCFDIQQMYVRSVLGKAHAHEMMKELADAGYTRAYITVPGDGLPAFSATRDNANTAKRDGRYAANVAACKGNIMKFYNDVAHEYGLKMIAVYKPYEGGGGLSIPEGAVADNCDWYEDTIGGRRVYFDNFVEKHPEMRLVRRDNGYVVDPNKNITKLEGVFVLDTIWDMNGAVQGSNYAGSFTAVTATQIQNALNTEGAHIKLYVSEDNHTYAEYTENYTISWQEDVRDYYDANGFLKIEDANVYVMNITGLNITPDTYVALVISEHVNRLLRTIPYTNLNFYSGSEKLTTSVTHFVRDVWGIGGSTPYNILWGYEREPQHTQGPTLYTEWTDSTGATRRSLYDMFTKYGFEFEYAGAGNGGEGWSTAKVYGMAVGKPQYVGGALCEGYAEVRQHWLDYTIYLLDDCNFDGIEYRMLGHSTFITDPINYGYNQPIVDKYKELYGVDISDPSVTITEEMYIKIMIIRGDFFMMFLDEVEKYTEEHDKFFGMHLIDAYADTSKYYESLKHTGMNSLISPYRPKIILNWKKCIDMCDEVSLKEYTWNKYNVQTCIEIKQYAYEKGKTCWTNVSRVMLEQNIAYCTAVDNDPYIGGIMWYEHPGEAALKQIYAVLGWAQVPIE